MFLKHDNHLEFIDLSLSVRDTADWKIGVLKEFEFPLDITAVAIDPVSRLLAIGTAQGEIRIRGGPGVEIKLLLPEAIPVRFLQFGLLSERLVCLDSGHHLHIWDLSPLGSPKHMAIVRWDPTTFIVTSPSHNHIFLALANGEVRTYDLACMRKSPYTLPNLWLQYENELLKSGISSIPHQDSTRQPVELVLHPRNLNLLFIAYEDGIILADLKDRKAVHTFELILPPGAPGGGGYSPKDILLPRRSLVTCIAIHPAGHFFAAGHNDGSISFWALEDSGQPILVRTLDDLDVNVVDAEMLEARLNNAADRDSAREPVIKLAWSGFVNSKDPRGGATTLTVLGGTRTDQGFGLNVLWFPAFNPEDPPATSQPPKHNGLHPLMINAIRSSLTESGSFYYATQTPIQDFHLVPRDNPHFNNTYGPYAILIVSEAGKTERTLESREFPPACLVAASQSSRASSPNHGGSQDLDLTLEALSLASDPQSCSLPFEFSGSNLSGEIYILQTVPKEIYPDVVDTVEARMKPKVKLSGGRAIVEVSVEPKRTKQQPHRILICPNKDLTVSFYDISDQLRQALENTPLQHDYPELISALEINLQDALDVLDSEQPRDSANEAPRSIAVVHFVPSTSECAIALSTGELLLFQAKPVLAAHKTHDFEPDPDLRLLKHVRVEPWRKLSPYFALNRMHGSSISSVAISEIGFVAAAFSDGALYIVDMRGPTILHRPSKAERRSSKSSKHSFSLHHITDTSTEVGAFTSLTWTISGIDKDPKSLIRLIAIRSSGNLEVYSISQSPPGFLVEGPKVSYKVIPNPLPRGTFVVNAKTGALCKADRRRFADMIHFHEQTGETVILVTASTKGVRSFVNITGERIGKAEWSSKYGEVIDVQIVERLGSVALVAYTDKSAVHVYSLPSLEHIHTIPGLGTPLKTISIDESGDFIGLNLQSSTGLVQSLSYGTLFNFRRTEEFPLVDLIVNKGKIPSQPQPVPMGPSSFRSWFQFNLTMSGQQIDDLLGGSNRPAPVMRARDVVSQRDLDDSSGDPAASIAASATAVQSNLYSRLTSALNERGQMLGDLEENFKSLEQGSKDMVSQAKRLAAQNSGKSWFGF